MKMVWSNRDNERLYKVEDANGRGGPLRRWKDKIKEHIFVRDVRG